LKKLSSVLLLATLCLLAEHVLVPVSAQQLAPNETAPAGVLLPPRIECIPTPATRLYMGMSEADVEQTMGAAAEVATSESAGLKIRVLKYRLSPIPAKITISDGRVSGVALDIAAADDRELPTYSRSVWPGMHRTAVLRMLLVQDTSLSIPSTKHPMRCPRSIALKKSRALLTSDWTARQASVSFSQAMAWLYISYNLAKVGMRINFSRVRLNSLSTKTSFSNSPMMKVTAPLKNWPVAAR
jgi:hypothetical protein